MENLSFRLTELIKIEDSIEILIKRIVSRVPLQLPMSSNEQSFATIRSDSNSMSISESEFRKIVREEIEAALSPLKTGVSPIKASDTSLGEESDQIQPTELTKIFHEFDNSALESGDDEEVAGIVVI